MLLVITASGYHDNNGGTADGFESEVDDQHDKIDWDEKEPVHRLQPDDIWGTVVQWLHLLRFFFKAATNSGWRRPYNCGFEALTKDHVLPG